MHSVGESGTNVPAFLAKLWKLVEDPALDDLISWNSNGLSFTIRDQARFARELLPLYYKHNNMASFVRQLNMYGFHKVVSLDSGGLKLDKDEMEFAHTYFIRGHEYLLEHIKRKIPVSKQDDSKVKPEMLTKVLSDVRVMRGKQETLDTRLAAMKRENEALWREVASLRQKHQKQQQIVNKLIQFLISVVQPAGRSGISLKRRYPLMLGADTSSSGSGQRNAKKEKRIVNINLAKAFDKGTATSLIANISPGGPTIHDVTDSIDNLNEGGVVELSLEPNITEEVEPLEEVQTVEVGDPVHELEILPDSLADQPTIEILSDKTDDANSTGIVTDQPDLSMVAELEDTEESAVLSSPLSPDLLLAVNPHDVVGKRIPMDFASSFSADETLAKKSVLANGKKSKTQETNGEAADKKNGDETEMRVAIVDNNRASLGSRDELDNHLDNVELDLDNLRELLSLQTSNFDPTTLLGLFSADEPAGFLNTLADAQRPMSSAAGSELMSYTPSLFELTTEDGQFLPDDSNLLVSDLVEEDAATEDKTDGLLDLLGVTESPRPAKKTKSS